MNVQNNWDFEDYPSDALEECKALIVKVIILMSKTRELQHFKSILYKILILTQSKYETPLTASFHKELVDLSSDIEILYESNNILQKVKDQCRNEVDYEKCGAIITFLKETYQQVKEDIVKQE